MDKVDAFHLHLIHNPKFPLPQDAQMENNQMEQEDVILFQQVYNVRRDTLNLEQHVTQCHHHFHIFLQLIQKHK
jgi:hypothetical protein